MNPLGSVLHDFLMCSLWFTLLFERMTGEENCVLSCGVDGPLVITPSEICFLYMGFVCDADSSGIAWCLFVEMGSDACTFGWRGRNILTGPK